MNVTLHGCDIDSKAQIGDGFRMIHTVGTVIGAVAIGERCTIYQNATIGARGDRPSPRIGADVKVFSGTAVLGDVEIGDGAVIGANSTVLRDVAAGARVHGVVTG